MAKTKTITTKTTATGTKTVVPQSTKEQTTKPVTKRKVTKSTLKAYDKTYQPAGIAYKVTTKDNTSMIVLKLNNGDTYIVRQPASKEQLKYFQYNTAKGYTNQKDIYDIYNSTFVVNEVITLVNEDIIPQHANEKASE